MGTPLATQVYVIEPVVDEDASASAINVHIPLITTFTKKAVVGTKEAVPCSGRGCATVPPARASASVAPRASPATGRPRWRRKAPPCATVYSTSSIVAAAQPPAYARAQYCL